MNNIVPDLRENGVRAAFWRQLAVNLEAHFAQANAPRKRRKSSRGRKRGQKSRKH